MQKYFRCSIAECGLKRIMRKSRLQQQRQIVMAVDRGTGIVFAIHLKGGQTQTVGTATLRMADVPEVVRLVTERLRIEDQLLAAESAARKSKKEAAKRWVHCI
jgi:hypothetical protein